MVVWVVGDSVAGRRVRRWEEVVGLVSQGPAGIGRGVVGSVASLSVARPPPSAHLLSRAGWRRGGWGRKSPDHGHGDEAWSGGGCLVDRVVGPCVPPRVPSPDGEASRWFAGRSHPPPPPCWLSLFVCGVADLTMALGWEIGAARTVGK